MKNLKKALVLFLCAVLLVAGSVMGTLAYLTYQDSATNTFTVGEVKIDLKEYDVDGQTGLKTTTVVDSLTALELIPGREIQKNPFITVDAGSESCWLFVKIENNLGDAVSINGLAGWTAVKDHAGYYQYNATVDAGATVTVFESITVDSGKTFADLSAVADETIVITAYAVQSEGIAQDDAWTALGEHYELG